MICFRELLLRKFYDFVVLWRSRSGKNGKLIFSLFLGIGGVVTFKNGKIDQFLNEIPLEKIVLETNSPYLAPFLLRGKLNEGSYLDLVFRKLVNIYKTDFSEIDRSTTENVERMFSK